MKSKGEAICEEFCDQVFVYGQIRRLSDLDSDIVDELKCYLAIDFFLELVFRMVDAGYCCTQIQRDVRTDKCFVWFRRMRPT